MEKDTTPGLKQKTAKGLLWGGIGSGASQLLNLAFGIFLARLLSPADYGVIGALTIFSAMAGIFSESGFTLAIVNKREVSDIDYNSVFWFNVTASVIFYALLFFLAPAIADFYHQPEMVPLARFLFLGFVSGGIMTAPSAYLFRNLQVKERSSAQVIGIIVSGTVGVTCASLGWGYWGLAVQTVTYSVTAAVVMWWHCPWRPSLKFSRESLLSMLPFSSKQLVTTLFTHINNNFFSVLLGRFYGMRPTGFYTQGSKWTTMGNSTITGMISSVGQPVLRETRDDPERLRGVFSKMMRFTAFVSFPAMFGLAITAEELITVTVTDKWLESVPVIRILCAGSAFLPIGVLYANLFNSLGRPNIYMWNTIGLGLTQLACVLVSYRFGLNTMLTVYSTVNILWICVWQHFARKYAGIRAGRVIRDIAPYAAISLAVMAVTVAVTSPLSHIPMLSLGAKVIVAVGLYSLVLWRLNSVMFSESVNYLLRRKSRQPDGNG